MKPPLNKNISKNEIKEPLGRITEKDETLVNNTESFEFTAQMEDIEERSRDPTLSFKRRSSVENTQIFNGASFDIPDFSSGEFKEYSFRNNNPTSVKSCRKMEDFGSSISWASVNSDSAHAQMLFPTKEQRVTLAQMRDNECKQSQ